MYLYFLYYKLYIYLAYLVNTMIADITVFMILGLKIVISESKILVF